MVPTVVRGEQTGSDAMACDPTLPELSDIPLATGRLPQTAAPVTGEPAEAPTDEG